MSTYASVIAGLNRDFILEFVKNEKPANFSMFSLFHTLLILMKSMKGPAYDQLLGVLKLRAGSLDGKKIRKLIKSISGDKATETAANIFARRVQPLPAYAAMMKATFDAEVEPLVSVAQVNHWCSAKTHGMIPKLLETLGAETVVLLISALYFKADWAEAFPPHSTTTADFTRFDGGVARKPLMYRQGKIAYAETRASQVAVLPYAGSDVLALVALPKKAGRAAMLKSIAELDATLFAAAVTFSVQKIKLYLPRFEADATMTLNEELQRLGATEMFSSCDTMDSFGTKLAVSDVIQRCVVKVDEKGTTAAAATAVCMRTACAGRPPRIPIMRCDHPFAFVLFHRASGVPLFTTVVTD
eukprot:gnl/Chilomastix_cuspidata/646.p1 GENE.gnl/Chilomastix_cuspidata/646~~gnl/Chilomastix_cuspidata/646.p1  ORF type:complete len:357 (-),score=105.79 gnl/Chilomastix_cuspidata/646:35-1105(-)